MKRIVKIVLIGIFLLLVIYLSFVLIKYFSWRKTFNDQKMIMNCTSNMPEVGFNTDEKIKNFVLSNSSTAYIEFSIDETLSFLKNYVDVSDMLTLNDLCVNTQRGQWEVYLDLKFGEFNIPWIKFDVVKDVRETAELYVSNLYLGDTKIHSVISQKILTNMNKGISDGILMVNENNFLGRNISNIELLEDKIVVR